MIRDPSSRTRNVPKTAHITITDTKCSGLFGRRVNIKEKKIRMCLARLSGYITEPYSHNQGSLKGNLWITASAILFVHALMYGIPVRRYARSLN
jgi:hypothetical protein